MRNEIHVNITFELVFGRLWHLMSEQCIARLHETHERLSRAASETLMKRFENRRKYPDFLRLGRTLRYTANPICPKLTRSKKQLEEPTG